MDHAVSLRHPVAPEARLVHVLGRDAGPELHQHLVWHRRISDAGARVDVRELREGTIRGVSIEEMKKSEGDVDAPYTAYTATRALSASPRPRPCR